MGLARAMSKRAGNTSTGEGYKGKKGQDYLRWSGWEICEWEVQVHGWKMCEWELYRWENWTRTSHNPFESSRIEKPQYFVDVVKNKRTKNNNLELLIGWRDFPDPHLRHVEVLDTSPIWVQRHRPSVWSSSDVRCLDKTSSDLWSQKEGRKKMWNLRSGISLIRLFISRTWWFVASQTFLVYTREVLLP